MGKYQPFHDLDVAKFDALKADIALRGVVIPVLVDENGVTIDGHQRRRAAAELHLPCPQTVVKGLNDEDKMALALALNAHRRHLSGTERSKAVGRLRSMGWSIRDIAETLQAGVATVHRDLAGVPDGTPAVITGKDGRTYAATRPSGNHGSQDKATVVLDPDSGEYVEVDPETGEVLSNRPSGQLDTDGSPSESPNVNSGDETPAPAPKPPETIEERNAREAEQGRLDRNVNFGKYLIGLWALLGDGDKPIDDLIDGWVPEECPAWLVEPTRFVFTPDGMRDLARTVEKLAAKWEAAGV